MDNMLPNVLENLIDVLFQQGQGFMDYRVRGTSTETTVTLKFSSHDTSSTPEVKHMNSKARRNINRITRFNEHFNSVDSGNNTESSYTGQSTVDLNSQPSSTPNLEGRSTQNESFCNQDIEGPSQTVNQGLGNKSKQSSEMNTLKCQDVQLKFPDYPLSQAETLPAPNTCPAEYDQIHKNEPSNPSPMNEPLQEQEHLRNKHYNHEPIIGKTPRINSNISVQRNKEVQCCPTMKCVETQRTLLTKTKSTDTFQLAKCSRRNIQTQVMENDLETEEDTSTKDFNEMCKAAAERSLTKFDNMIKLQLNPDNIIQTF